jgi:hypothetical protein
MWSKTAARSRPSMWSKTAARSSARVGHALGVDQLPLDGGEEGLGHGAAGAPTGHLRLIHLCGIERRGLLSSWRCAVDALEDLTALFAGAPWMSPVPAHR